MKDNRRNKKSKIITLSIIGVIFILIVIGGILMWNNFKGAIPAFSKPSAKIADLLKNSSNSTSESSSLKEGSPKNTGSKQTTSRDSRYLKILNIKLCKMVI